MALRERIYHMLEVEDHDHGLDRAVHLFLLLLIIANVLAVVLETVQSLYQRHAWLFDAFEIFSVAIFTIEYLLRLWTCTVNPRYREPLRGRLRFIVSPMALIDLTAILPAYLPALIPLDLRFARSVRLFRLARSLKIARYSHALQTLGGVLRAKKEELAVTAFLGSVLLLFASSFMYFIEHEAQPEAFSSIPASMWWGVMTLTTVGYGDYPVTPLGKFVGAIIGILGIGLFALPAGILAGGFAEEMHRKHQHRKCPQCGAALD
jgi:voltage-gated potassium channel